MIVDDVQDFPNNFERGVERAKIQNLEKRIDAKEKNYINCRKSKQEGILQLERVAKKLTWKEIIDPVLASSVQSTEEENCIVLAN